MNNVASWSSLALVTALSVFGAGCSADTEEASAAQEDPASHHAPTVDVTHGVNTNAVVVTPVCTPPLCRGPASESGRPTFVRGYCYVSLSNTCSCGCGEPSLL